MVAWIQSTYDETTGGFRCTRGSSSSLRPRIKTAEEYVPPAANVAAWEALSETDGEGFLQALDALIDKATAQGLDPEQYAIMGTHELFIYYDRFVLGRHQNHLDDWFALPGYKGWRFSEDPRWNRKNVSQVALFEYHADRYEYTLHTAVPNRRVDPAAFETFERLFIENDDSVSLDDLLLMAEGLA